eukprot:TRINITY_DN44590_c0_g1_i2.p1 TRINITY_DN44590_c0_g1~~TRINITY_DN44590_c0_g1_i2.p1  ORF type:complete len:253 (-),score=18.51 TRINITY_DN44590_c0_g1_i2:143-901(-)
MVHTMMLKHQAAPRFRRMCSAPAGGAAAPTSLTTVSIRPLCPSRVIPAGASRPSRPRKPMPLKPVFAPARPQAQMSPSRMDARRDEASCDDAPIPLIPLAEDDLDTQQGSCVAVPTSYGVPPLPPKQALSVPMITTQYGAVPDPAHRTPSTSVVGRPQRRTSRTQKTEKYVPPPYLPTILEEEMNYDEGSCAPLETSYGVIVPETGAPLIETTYMMVPPQQESHCSSQPSDVVAACELLYRELLPSCKTRKS